MLRHMSIRGKLVLALGGAALLAFAVAAAALVLFESLTLENRARQLMNPYAHLVSVGAEAAVAFEDPQRAQEVLNTLRVNPQVLEAEIFLKDGTLLASYRGGAGVQVPKRLIQAEGFHVKDDHAELIHQLQNGARLRLVMNLKELNRGTHQILWAFTAGVAVLLAVMSGLLLVLQRTIVLPVSTLARATEQVRTRADYRQRVPAAGDDEVARLGQSFNAMMSAIEERESDLHRLSAFQRTLLDAAAHGIISATPDGVVTSFNPAAERLLGYRADEVVGTLTPMRWHDPEEVMLRAGRLSEELGEPVAPGFDVFTARPRRNLREEHEWTFIRKDRTRVPVLLSVTALRSEAGEITGYVGMTYDLSERNKAEEALRKSAKEIQDLYDHAPCGYHSVDRNGVIVRINDTELEWLGYARDEVIGKKRFADFLTPDAERAFRTHFHQFKIAGAVRNVEFDLIRKNGTEMSVLVSATAITDARGNFLMSRSVVSDVTERKRLLARERMRVVVFEKLIGGEPLPDILDSIVRGVEAERKSVIASIMLLDAKRRHLQHGAAPSLPRFYNDAIHGMAIGPAAGSCGTAAHTGQRVIVEDIATHPCWARFRELARRAELGSCWAQPVCNRQGQVIGTFAIYHREPCTPTEADLDLMQVTANLAGVAIEHRQTQDEIRRLNAELEQRVVDRTRALADSEARFRTLYETAPVSIWLEDWSDIIGAIAGLRAKGVQDFAAYFRDHPSFINRALTAVKILDVNQCTLGMFEAKDKTEMLASLETVFATPDTVPGFVGEVLALANGETTYRTEMALNTVRGDTIHGLLSMSFPPPGAESGNVLVSVVDITDRKQAEEALRKSDERMRLYFERQLVGNAITSPEKGWLQVNDKICEMLGYTREELLRMTWAEMTYPEDLAPDVDQFERLLSGEIEDYTLEKRFVRKDGSLVYANLAVGCVRRPDRSVDYVLAFLEDITERKRAEAQLRRRSGILAAINRVLRETLASATDTEVGEVFLQVADRLSGSEFGFVFERNAAGKFDTLTVDKHAWEGAEPGVVMPRDIAPAGLWEQVVNTGASLIVNDAAVEAHGDDGMPPGFAPVRRFLGVPLCDGAKVVGVVGLVNKAAAYTEEDREDVETVTPAFVEALNRKRAQRDVLRLNEQLRGRADALEQANKELEAFSYSVSHDLRAPLRHIDGFVDMLNEKMSGKLDDEASHYMTQILNASKRMGVLIEDLLSFSRMGRRDMASKPVVLGKLVTEVIQQLEPETSGRDVDWQIGDLPTVEGDPAMLQVVLFNLLANAVKFTRPRKQAKIEVDWRPGPGAAVTVYVRDNGVGFDMKYVDKLFGVFQRLHGTDEFEGTGIGLANVRRIIVRHGGRAWAEGRPGDGATFYFSLPQGIEGERD